SLLAPPSSIPADAQQTLGCSGKNGLDVAAVRAARQILNALAKILDQMKAISNLEELRRADAPAAGEGASAIAATN
ncbi:MAG: hypothetical protein ACE5FO_14235, partial [Parvularculaceae bacterium]